MKHRLLGKVGIVLLCVIICGGLFEKKTYAASAAVNLRISAQEVMVDDTFSVVLSVESSEAIGAFSCYLSFDSDVLQFVSGGAFVTGGTGLIMISDEGSSEEETTNKKYSMKLKAIKGGETSIWVDEDVSVTCALDDAPMSVSCNQLLFSITDPERISDITALQNITVSQGSLDPAFDPTCKKYQLTIPASADQIEIKATPMDEDASVMITGNEELLDGSVITITVTAPSKDQEVTTIRVKKKEENDEANSPKEEQVQETTDPTIGKVGVSAARDEKENIFLTEELRVQILPLQDESLLPQDYIKTTIVKDGVSIPVYTKKSELDSDVLLLYGMNQEGETGFYSYNRRADTLTRVEALSKEFNQRQEESTLNNGSKQEGSLQTSSSYLIAVLAVLCMILSVVLAYVLIRFRNQRYTDKNEKGEDDF